ncbi:MAG TPA: VOC family protein [Lapillicoccus sp.]|nr:VOC family protein [Lapillicoccus sp.]
MVGRVTHIAINADDDGITQGFYEDLFDWRFEEAYPGFARTALPPAEEMVAAVQARRELLPGLRSNGPEVTIEVDDLNVVLAQVDRLGGQVVMERATIPGVGDLVFLADPSGNVVGVIQYARV